MAKTLDLYRHTHKDAGGNNISYDGATYAYEVGSERYDQNVKQPVHHLFWGPLVRTCQTAIAMMACNQAFEKAQLHEAINGLGSSELFATLITDQVRAAIKNGSSNMEAVINNADKETLARFENDACDALDEMFNLMADGQHGVGIFHDPTIPLVAKFLGMEDARSLESMEAIRFTDNEGEITASWIK